QVRRWVATRLRRRPKMDAEITIRVAGEDDASSLERLAQLDSRRVPAGPLLLAERGSRPIAALVVDGGEAIADPFVHTEAAIELLRLRASQLMAVDRRRFRLRRWGAFTRMRRSAA
ncbi:MAG: hypothetical protein ACR2K6_02495, partial [Solirubrobacterales bacterium]